LLLAAVTARKVIVAVFHANTEILDWRKVMASDDEKIKELNDKVRKLEEKADGLEKQAFKLKVIGTAVALGVLVGFGFTLQSVPRAIAESVATESARTEADKFAKNKLPGLVEDQLKSEHAVVTQIKVLKDRAVSDSEVCTKTAANVRILAEQIRQRDAEANGILNNLRDGKLTANQIDVGILNIVDKNGVSRIHLATKPDGSETVLEFRPDGARNKVRGSMMTKDGKFTTDWNK
jgi:hypothetical protein